MYGAEYGWALGSILVFSCSGSLGRPTAGQPEPTSQASQNKTETNSNQVAKETQVKLNCAAMMLFLPCISLYFSQSTFNQPLLSLPPSVGRSYAHGVAPIYRPFSPCYDSYYWQNTFLHIFSLQLNINF